MTGYCIVRVLVGALCGGAGEGLKLDVHGGVISLHRIRMYKAPRLIDRRVFAVGLVVRKRPRMT